jgi:hypothetical protein
MRIQIGLSSPQDVDAEIHYLLSQAYLENS